MIQKHGLLIILIFSVYLLPSPGLYPDDGNDYENIDELEILKKIEKEIGEKVSFSKKQENDAGKKTSEKLKSKDAIPSLNQPSYKVTVTVQSGEKLNGFLFLTQEYIKLHLNNENNQQLNLPLRTIKIIKFSNWGIENDINRNDQSASFFVPKTCNVETFNGNSYSGNCQSLDWLQIVLENDYSKIFLRNYFTGESDGDVSSMIKEFPDLFLSIEFSEDKKAPEGQHEA